MVLGVISGRSPKTFQDQCTRKASPGRGNTTTRGREIRKVLQKVERELLELFERKLSLNSRVKSQHACAGSMRKIVRCG